MNTKPLSTASPEWIASAIIQIARQPATPDGDSQLHGMIVAQLTSRTPLERAAPDLLATCKHASDELDGDPHRVQLQAFICDAIAKATT